MSEKKGVLPVQFSTLVIPFYTQALVKLGKRTDLISGKIKIKLEEAKNIIDIIELLKEKTEGNLSEKEENFINNVLNELKSEYLKKKKDESKEN